MVTLFLPQHDFGYHCQTRWMFFFAIFISSDLFKLDNTRGHFAYILIETVLIFSLVSGNVLSKTCMVMKLLHSNVLFILDRCNIFEYGVNREYMGCAGVLEALVAKYLCQ